MRSTSQSALYFAAIVEPLQKFYEQNPDKLFTDMFKVLKGHEGKDLVHFLLKCLFNSGKTTRFEDKDVITGKERFSDYVETIREFYRTNHKLDLRSINEVPIEYY